MAQGFEIHAVTVYCSSSSKLAAVHNEAAAELGRALAHNGWKLVYGGNNVGMMGILADAVREAGGKVVGVTPQLFVDKGSADELCDELIVTSGMRDRKAAMEERGDAFIALPGGLGTFEEIFEIICGKVLGYHNKPIVLLNVDGYYDPLLAMIEHGVEQNFIKAKARELYFVTLNVAEAVEHIRTYAAPAPAERTFETSKASALE
jgi:cytokinin riboside 5'-monophosphate phosphoribohydrolase